MPGKPDCYKCIHRRNLPGDAHSRCSAYPLPKVVAKPLGIRNGWFLHPFNFDPVWLEECSGFAPKP